MGTEWDKYEIAEIAYQAERMVLGIDGGWQDQYACAFGGFNNRTDAIKTVTPIRLVENIKNELEENLVLCFTGMQHNSANIEEQSIGSVKEEKADEILESCNNREINEGSSPSWAPIKIWYFGRNMEFEAQPYKNYDNPWLDEFYLEAVNAGATGGKLLVLRRRMFSVLRRPIEK